jgi:putative sigma-54 modulation protein
VCACERQVAHALVAPFREALLKINYTGKTDGLLPNQSRKLASKLEKLGRLLDGPKGEKEAHIIISTVRHLQHVEITLSFHDHQLVGVGSDGDLYTAMNEAIEKIEKQIRKLKTKWRDTKRGYKETWEEHVTAQEATPGGYAPEAAVEDEGPQVIRVDHHDRRKPMTLDEALIEMEFDRDYFVYRDAATDRVSVLIRRRDGNFDLVEA